MLRSPGDRPYDAFYELGDPVTNPPFRGRFGVIASSEEIQFIRGESRPSSAVAVEWAMGSPRPSDVIWTTCFGPLIVSQRVIRLLETGGFTGWATYPVAVVDKYDTPVPGYAGLSITGRCGVPDLSLSEVVVREYPGGWYPKLRGRYFPLESWDGTDLFMERPDERGHAQLWRYATARLVDALRRERIKNLTCVRLTEIELATSIYNSDELPRDHKQRVAEAYARQGVPRPRGI